MSIKCPEHRRKRIYWHDGKGTAVILVGYCPDTLAYFNALATEARKDFDINEEAVICGRVTRSSSIQNFTFIMFDIDGPKRDVDGWDSYNSTIDFGY